MTLSTLINQHVQIYMTKPNLVFPRLSLSICHPHVPLRSHPTAPVSLSRSFLLDLKERNTGDSTQIELWDYLTMVELPKTLPPPSSLFGGPQSFPLNNPPSPSSVLHTQSSQPRLLKREPILSPRTLVNCFFSPLSLWFNSRFLYKFSKIIVSS